MHFGRFTQEYFHWHINGVLLIWISGLLLIVQLQLAILGGVSDDRIGAALALTHLGKTLKVFWMNCDHIALLRLVAPDLCGAHAALF